MCCYNRYLITIQFKVLLQPLLTKFKQFFLD